MAEVQPLKCKKDSLIPRRTTMQIDHLQKCAHQPCVCQVTKSDEYCSANCRKHAAENADTCTCGHVDCAVEPEPLGVPLASPA